MAEEKFAAAEFEANRARLRAVAYRMLGSQTEAVTRIADRPDPVPDDVWKDAAEHYGENELAALIASIAQINVWNRFNATVRQMAGQKWN